MSKTFLINLSCVVGLWLVLIYGCTPCRYDKFPGVVTVTDIQPTARGKSRPDSPDATVTISFEFTPDKADVPQKILVPPPPLVVTKKAATEKGIAVGRRYQTVRHAETQGTCTPPEPFLLSEWKQRP